MPDHADLLIDLERRELRDASGEHVELRRRSFELLLYLAQNLDRVVSKGELIEKNWNGLAVTDDSLTKCISDIRNAFGPKLRDTVRTVRAAATCSRVGVRAGPRVNWCPSLQPKVPASCALRRVESLWSQSCRSTIPAQARTTATSRKVSSTT